MYSKLYTNDELQKIKDVITTPRIGAKLWFSREHDNMPIYIETYKTSLSEEGKVLWQTFEMDDFQKIPETDTLFCKKITITQYNRNQNEELRGIVKTIITMNIEMDIQLENQNFLFLCNPNTRVVDMLNNKIYLVGEDGKLNPPLETILGF
jgi:hypothetical protein